MKVMLANVGRRTTGTEAVSGNDLAAETDPASRRRFTRAVFAGVAVTALPYLWVLTTLWNGRPSLLRTARADGYASNFYDLQARAMLAGHLYVKNGALGGEAFVHGGHQFTYFGLFPSLLRIPVLAITHQLDGRLTVLSMLLAWLVTALTASLLLWRVRIILRDQDVLSVSEAVACGVLVATVTGGSILVYLASNPWVFSEDLAWSVALMVASLFAVIGILERPSWYRVVGCGVVVVAANLNRGTTGYACVIGVLLSGAWFALDPGSRQNRRWAAPVLLAGAVAMIAGCAVSYAKFHVLFGLPASSQIVFQAFGLNRLNGGSYFAPKFLGTNLLAYFQPVGIRVSHIFPFITLPAYPAAPVGGVVGFGADRVGSVPASMPLLFFASIWGTVAAFRRMAPGRGVLLRIPLIAAVLAGVPIMIYGWTENRFTADFMPFLVLGSTIGLIDVWRLLDRPSPRTRRRRRSVLVLVGTLGTFGVVVNVALATTYQNTWSANQGLRFVEAQQAVASATGQSLATEITRGSALPDSSPPDQLFIGGPCNALYIAEGEPPTHAPRITNPDLINLLGSGAWLPLEVAGVYRAMAHLTVRGPTSGLSETVVATIGTGTNSLVIRGYGADEVQFVLHGPGGVQIGSPFHPILGRPFDVSIATDPYLDGLTVTSSQRVVLQTALADPGPVTIVPTPAVTSPSEHSLTVVATPRLPDTTSVCRTLQHR